MSGTGSRTPLANGSTTPHHRYGATTETRTTAVVAAVNGGFGEPHGHSGTPAGNGLVPGQTTTTTTTTTTVDEEREQLEKRSTLKLCEKIGYGLGHVYNDLCAGVWFSYTLLFMQGALGMPAAEAGAMVMLGQVGDAIATPIVGLLTDRYGTKRQWHIFGTFIVFLTFPMIFSLCPWCTVAPHWWEIVYFTAVILAFQFGWPIVQVTHLAMIPELSRTQKDRSDLTAVRYSVSIVSNVIVYIVTWAVLRANRSTAANQIGPTDAYRFRDISLILTLVGVSMSVLFNFSLTFSGYEHRRNTALQHNVIRPSLVPPTTPGTDIERESLLGSDQRNGGPMAHPDAVTVMRKPKKNFFKSPLLYQNALLYVFSRLFMTTSLVYMPLWLDERSYQPNGGGGGGGGGDGPAENSANVEHLATVPLVSFLVSFVSSLALKYGNRFVGNSAVYFVGSVVSISVCLWIALTPPAGTFSTVALYVIASLFGAGSSITMISSLCITADMIGKHADQGGFIYSAVTFADKLITGVVVVIIESVKCRDRTECPEYYRGVLSYGCGLAALLGCLTLATLLCTRAASTSRRTRS